MEGDADYISRGVFYEIHKKRFFHFITGRRIFIKKIKERNATLNINLIKGK